MESTADKREALRLATFATADPVNEFVDSCRLAEYCLGTLLRSPLVRLSSRSHNCALADQTGRQLSWGLLVHVSSGFRPRQRLPGNRWNPKYLPDQPTNRSYPLSSARPARSLKLSRR